MHTQENMFNPIIRLFVFGTLRAGQRLDYYMEGTHPQGLFYTRGQLMESERGSAYIEFEDQDQATIGEVYLVNFFCLQRIDHMESHWGEFPKGYSLGLVPTWPCPKDTTGSPFAEDQKQWAFCYKRKVKGKIRSGDWTQRMDPVTRIERYLRGASSRLLGPQDLLSAMSEHLDR